jgi:thymidylate synthase (FAD)
VHERIPVLDRGYVVLRDVLGSDLTVANAARASYGVRHEALDDRDRRLIRYLWRHGHQSPFYHPKLQFEIKAPLMVARQWWKHVVDSAHTMETPAWNEVSRRYVVSEPEFYIPERWRQASRDNKQASGDFVDEGAAQTWTERLRAHVAAGLALYQAAVDAGLAGEEARAFLPANIQYTSWYWTASLYAVVHFVDLRRHEAAQREIQAYADVIARLVADAFPETWAVMTAEPGAGGR